MKTLSSPKPDKASLFAPSSDSCRSFLSVTTLIPFPPPPAAAFIRSGYPIFLTSFSFEVIGRVGTLAFIASSLAFNLSPITEMTLGEGPTQIIFSLMTLLANSEFSDKKPYPG